MGEYEQDQARIPIPIFSDRRAEDHACPDLRMLLIRLQLGTQPEKHHVSGDREIARLCCSLCDVACSENPVGDGMAFRGLFRPVAIVPAPPRSRLCQLLRRTSQVYVDTSSPTKLSKLFSEAPGGYNAALDLSHTALRAESEGERYTGMLHCLTLAFALRV